MKRKFNYRWLEPKRNAVPIMHSDGNKNLFKSYKNYIFHPRYKENVIPEPQKVAHESLRFPETQFEY
jgi:hypothetical protein